MSKLHKSMNLLKERMMREVTVAVAEGLPPLGALTVTLAAVEEQVCAILRGAALKERLLPSDQGDGAVEQYYAIVQEMLDTVRVHVAELYRIAQAQAANKPGEDQAQREVSELQRLFDSLDISDRKPS